MVVTCGIGVQNSGGVGFTSQCLEISTGLCLSTTQFFRGKLMLYEIYYFKDKTLIRAKVSRNMVFVDLLDFQSARKSLNKSN